MLSFFFIYLPLILQSLDFDLIVFAPYRSVEGFVDDMEVSLANPLFIQILLSYLHKKNF